jgi:methionine-rich copper-binding protein CopC
MLRKLIATLAFVAALLALGPGAASAHAELDRALPEPESTVDHAPAQVELWFTEELADGSTATVSGSDGSQVDNGDAAIDLFDPERKHLVVTLQSGLPAGVYTVAWTSISGEDEDTESGTFAFTVSASATPVASPVASPIASPSPAASPASAEETTAVTQAGTEPTEPNTRALLIALAVGLGAAALIYGFWLLVKPKT